MSLNEFEIECKLGQGTYSTVYRVRRLEDNKIYALKRVNMLNMPTKERQNAVNQIRILASIHHPNVIGYKQAFLDESTKSLCIIMQYANDGDLMQLITKNKKNSQFLNQTQIWQIFIQIVQGLKQLHDLKIMHRDIKSANIFLHDKIFIKIGDMNISKILQRGLCITQTGTPYYASPQVWKDQPYNQKSDIWSLGCVLYEMICLKPPFESQDMQGLYKKVVRGIYSRIPSIYSQELSSMIRNLLQIDPKMRPSCDKILKIPIIMNRININNKINKNILNNLNKNDQIQKQQLLKTIKPDNFYIIKQQLPKSNYKPIKINRNKCIKSLITIQDNNNNNKNNNHIINFKERKISEIQISNNKINQLNIQNNQHKIELKLPKVNNNKKNYNKQKIHKQNSLRYHKIYQG